MGGKSSLPAKANEEQNHLTDTEWRRTQGWDVGVKNNLKAAVADLSPVVPSQVDVPFFNILITGQVAAGKSSFYNSVYNIYRNRVSNPAKVGQLGTSLTQHYHVYEVSTRFDAEPLPWRICDTMGLQAATNETDVTNIMAAIDGHVPDGHEFGHNAFNHTSDGWIASPLLKDKAHCVAIVIDAKMALQMRETTWNNLRSMRKALIDRQIPVFILLTKIDRLCPHVKDDITLVYRSKAVRRAIEHTSKKLDAPEKNIFPIKNYTWELDFEHPMDILLLDAVHQMVLAAQDYLKQTVQDTDTRHQEDQVYSSIVVRSCTCGKNIKDPLKASCTSSTCPCHGHKQPCTRKCRCFNCVNPHRSKASVESVTYSNDGCNCGIAFKRSDPLRISCRDGKRKCKCPCVAKGLVCTSICKCFNCSNTIQASNNSSGFRGLPKKSKRETVSPYKRKKGATFLTDQQVALSPGSWKEIEILCLIVSRDFIAMKGVR